ncbi:MAG: hypothetical protein WCV91_05520, partial [Candidatus Margulisiibacteriota bacterium]
MYREILNPIELSSFENLKQLRAGQQKDWIRTNFKEILKALLASNEESNYYWNLIGYICINGNLYKEAEMLYDELFKKTQRQKKNIGMPAYLRGIAHFLQGRFQEASADFKIAHAHDLQIRDFHTPSAQAVAYMEDTLFPTREMIRKNQAKLIHDLNVPRVLGHAIGKNNLRIIHKWNSASPLYSRGVSQGGGYFLTLRGGKGEVKGVAIDPGYDFFDIFRDLGMGIADIDALILTHDHDDHTQSVEAILSLLAKYNDHNEQKKTKVMDIFGSAGTLLKFH